MDFVKQSLCHQPISRVESKGLINWLPDSDWLLLHLLKLRLEVESLGFFSSVDLGPQEVKIGDFNAGIGLELHDFEDLATLVLEAVVHIVGWLEGREGQSCEVASLLGGRHAPSGLQGEVVGFPSVTAVNGETN